MCEVIQERGKSQGADVTVFVAPRLARRATFAPSQTFKLDSHAHITTLLLHSM
jgi:hypothetical protein